MADDASTAGDTGDTTGTTGDGTPPPAAEEGKTFTQEQVNTFLAEQKRKIGDVKELKAAAAELATIKESQKTEAQKTADRLAAAERDVAEARNESLRYRIAAEFKLTDKQSAALAHISSEDGMRDVAGQFAATDAERKKQGNFVPREGNNPKSGGDNDVREFTRQLFATGD